MRLDRPSIRSLIPWASAIFRHRIELFKASHSCLATNAVAPSHPAPSLLRSDYAEMYAGCLVAEKRSRAYLATNAVAPNHAKSNTAFIVRAKVGLPAEAHHSYLATNAVAPSQAKSKTAFIVRAKVGDSITTPRSSSFFRDTMPTEFP